MFLGIGCVCWNDNLTDGSSSSFAGTGLTLVCAKFIANVLLLTTSTLVVLTLQSLFWSQHLLTVIYDSFRPSGGNLLKLTGYPGHNSRLQQLFRWFWTGQAKRKIQCRRWWQQTFTVYRMAISCQAAIPAQRVSACTSIFVSSNEFQEKLPMYWKRIKTASRFINSQSWQVWVSAFLLQSSRLPRWQRKFFLSRLIQSERFNWANSQSFP